MTTAENRGKWTGYMRGGQTLGFPAGLVAGGLVANLVGFRAAFALAGVADVLALVVAYFVLPDLRATVEDQTKLREVPRLTLSDLRVFAIGLTNFVGRFLYAGILLSTIVTYADTNGIRIGFLSATGVSGVVMAVSAVFAAIATVVVGNAADRLPDRALASLPSLAVFGTGFAVLAFVPTLPGTLIGVAAIGAGVEGTSLPLLAYLGDISPADDVGKLGGVYNVFGDFGATLGPLVALPLADPVQLLGRVPPLCRARRRHRRAGARGARRRGFHDDQRPRRLCRRLRYRGATTGIFRLISRGNGSTRHQWAGGRERCIEPRGTRLAR